MNKRRVKKAIRKIVEGGATVTSREIDAAASRMIRPLRKWCNLLLKEVR